MTAVCLAFAACAPTTLTDCRRMKPLFKHHEHVNVPPLDRAQLQAVVTGPPRALGVTFENDKIADRITDAAAAEPGALPLLSYLLTDMWADMVKRGKPILGLPAQAIDIGGVLASRAEAFLKNNPAEEKALRRLLTLKLAIVPAEGEPVRRQTHREECTKRNGSLAARLADHPYRLVVMGEREARWADRCRGGTRSIFARLAAAGAVAARGARLFGLQRRGRARRAPLARLWVRRTGRC